MPEGKPEGGMGWRGCLDDLAACKAPAQLREAVGPLAVLVLCLLYSQENRR